MSLICPGAIKIGCDLKNKENWFCCKRKKMWKNQMKQFDKHLISLRKSIMALTDREFQSCAFKI